MIELEDVSRLDIKPGETLVVRMHRVLSEEHMSAVRERVLPHLPDGVRLLVVGSDVDLSTLAQS